MIEVQLPDGRVIEFPAGTAPDVMRRVAAQAVQQPAAPSGEGVPGPRQEGTGRGSGFMPFLNRGIAAIAGAPVDIANAVIGMDPRYLPFGVGRAASAAGARPIPVSETPFGGSASIESALAAAGRPFGAEMVPEPGQQPETVSEYVGRSVGDAAGMLMPGYGAARLAAGAASPIVARTGRSVSNAFVNAPARTTAAELTTGAGSGYGRVSAEEAFPDVPNVGATGELVGGLGTGALLQIPSLLTKLPGVQVARSAVAPFLPSAAQDRAANRLAGLSDDPLAASRAAEGTSIANLTPAQRTGEPRLLALEKAVADENPAIAKALRERAAAAQETLEAEARTLGGDPAQTRAFLENRVTRLTDALNTRVEQAQTRARERIAALEPNAPADEASRIAREEFDKAYRSARAQESALWKEIPDDVKINTETLFARFAQLVEDTPVTQRHNIPDYAKRFLSREPVDEQAEAVTAQLNMLYPGAFPARPATSRLSLQASPQELQGLRSELLDIERAARDAGRRNEARIAGKIADDVLATLNSLPDTAGPYAVARDFSTKLNATFRNSETGALTRTAGGTEPRVAPELTLETLLKSGGPRADVAARDLLAATNDSPVTRQAIEDYLTRSFRDRAVSTDGRVKPESAANWMRRNDALLQRFPEVRNRLAETVSAQSQAETLAARQETVESGLRQRGDTRMGRLLDQRQESAVARFLNAEPGAEVSRVFSADDPAALAASLRRSVDRDPSGQALAGLRGAFVDDLLGRARQTTADGQVFNGSVIMDALNDPKQAAALKAVFDPPALQRLRQIGAELTTLERARGQLPSIDGVMQDTPSKVLEIVGRVVAARTAAQLGSGTGMAGGLQSAQIASSNMREFLTKLTRDRANKLLTQAVTDPDLFATLMSPMRTAKQQDVAARRLQAWMAGTAGRAAAGEEEDNRSPNAMAPEGARANVNAFAR
jgi:hypothetical protein